MASNAAVPISLGYDPDLGVPLAGQEGYRPKGSGDGFIDERFGGLDDRGSGIGSRGLKQFLERESNRRESPTVHLPENVTGNVRYDGEKWECHFSFGDKECMGTGETRDGAIMAAAKYITSQTVEPDVVDLSDSQLNLIGSLAQGGRLDEALEKYVRLSVTNKKATATKILSDPRYEEMLDRAAWFVWSRANNEYTLSDDRFPFFVERFAAGKRFTLALLNEAWKHYKERSARYEREQVVAARFAGPSNPAEIREALNNASDAEIAATMSATARHIARGESA